MMKVTSYVSVLSDELNVPKTYIREPEKPNCNRLLVAVHRCWLRELARTGSLCEFIQHEKFVPGDICARLKICEPLDSSWTQILVTMVPKSERRVIPLPRQRTQPHTIDDDLTYSQLLQYISFTNHKNLWKDTFKKYGCQFTPSSKTKENSSSINLVLHDTAVRDIITRLYGCSITRLHQSVSVSTNVSSYEAHPNILTACLALETNSFFYILQEHSNTHTLQDCLNYSPAIFRDAYFNPLFIIYQLLRLMRDVHDRGLALGDISLSDIYIADNLWVQVIPRITDNIYDIPRVDRCHREQITKRGTSTSNLHNYLSTNTMPHRDTIELGQYCELWVRGAISNFEYLTILNKLAGRKFGDPRRHYVFPWVTDFTSRNGLNWRDLTKSKFRLNKGDRQLDLTYELPANDLLSQVPHHVSDILSEITYYIYLSRVTPRSVLCNYVRTQWVPAEYPVSIQRLQQWTPDECIPEFFSDESIFYSIHNDLPDLEIPPWANNAQDFINCHRNALESTYVSERLHHWIDLTFGYKLSGPAAVKAKNVCLQLVDNHTNLTSSGIVQLFNRPHPQRLIPSPYLSKTPPRFLKQKSCADDDEDHSSGVEDSETQLQSSVTLSKLLSRSHTSLNQFGSSTTLDGVTLHLPHNYNPILPLIAIETVHNFISYTCNKPKVLLNNIQVDSDKNLTTAYKQVVATRRAQEMLVIGCIMVELFFFSKLRPVGGNLTPSSFKRRLESCRGVLCAKREEIPKCIRGIVTLLLQTDHISGCQISTGIRTYPIIDPGIPPPSAHQLLLPSLSSFLIPFPASFPLLYSTLKIVHGFSSLELEMKNIKCGTDVLSLHDSDKEINALLVKRINEHKVLELAKQLQALMELKHNEILSDLKWAEFLLPTIVDLLKNRKTNILAAWHLLELITRVLGPRMSRTILLEPALKLYEYVDESEDDDFEKSSNDNKSMNRIRIYHRSFLLRLMLRFGLKTFLDNFVPPILEAVAGFHDVDNSKNRLKPNPAHQLKFYNEISIFPSDNSAKSISDNSGTHVESPESTSDSTHQDEDKYELDEETDNSLASLRDVLMDDDGDIDEEQQYTSDKCCTSDDSGSNMYCNVSTALANTAPSSYSNSYWDNRMNIPPEKGFNESCKIADISSNSVIWLAHRLGPVLTARYLTRNLLRVLTVCYTGDAFADDRAVNVINCLINIAGIYGEQFIILQYIPQMSDLISACKRSKMTQALEGGLIGCVTLLRYIIPFLSDTTLSDIMQDVLCKTVLHPAIRILSSTKILFPSGAVTRSLFGTKLINCLYMLGLRQGHLISRSLQRFFLSFDKLRKSDNANFMDYRRGSKLNTESDKATFSDSTDSPPPAHVHQPSYEKDQFNTKVMEELCMVLTPELAFEAHSVFARHFGESFMQRSLINLNFIKELCALYKEERQLSGYSNKAMKNVSKGLEEYSGSRATVSGNKIHFQEANIEVGEQCKEIQDTSRHLRGNWLAYWEHEIGRLNTDFQFNFKQIKLQGFVGHTNTVKALHSLDNENSFISGSRDKTVKLWSIRSQGDGNNLSQCQYTYGNHRKSVLSIGFCERSRLIASCDSVIHLWDPFVGRLVSIIRNSPPINTLRSLPAPHSTILAATTHSSLNVLDTRTATFMAELRISMSASGLIRCIAVSPNSNWVAVGQSTGMVTVIDLRTGNIISSWKGHDGEVLQLVALDRNTLITSSLDQSISVWNISDGKLNFNMRGSLEPVHCLSVYHNELISGTTANRIGVHTRISNDTSFSSTKLRSDSFKGVLTTMTVLPLNKMLLLGGDTGFITLIC